MGVVSDAIKYAQQFGENVKSSADDLLDRGQEETTKAYTFYGVLGVVGIIAATVVLVSPEAQKTVRGLLTFKWGA